MTALGGIVGVINTDCYSVNSGRKPWHRITVGRTETIAGTYGLTVYVDNSFSRPFKKKRKLLLTHFFCNRKGSLKPCMTFKIICVGKIACMTVGILLTLTCVRGCIGECYCIGKSRYNTLSFFIHTKLPYTA